MKILFTSENYYPRISGVPVVVQYLAEGLADRKHCVAVATQQPPGTSSQELLNGVNIYRFPIFLDWKHSFRGSKKAYVDFILSYDADIVIIECTECITTDLLLPHLCKIKGKVIFHTHGFSGFDNKVFSIKDSLRHTFGTTYNWFNSKVYFNYTLKKAIKYIDAFMCLSEVDSGLNYIKQFAKKYYILDNAADNMFFDASCCQLDMLSKYTSLENRQFMMSCANYTVVKNQLGLIKQYYRSNASKRMSLVCIGSQKNSYYNDCIEQVSELEKKYGHRDVKLLQGVKREDIPAIVNKASLYLVSSSWEQYSISIIEAMSQGVPFISTNVGNARLLPGGMTIECIDEMHIAIDTLMHDNSKYKIYSEAGRKFAYDNCRIEVAVDKLEKILYEN